MSTTEDYLDQLLRNASGEGNDSIGESEAELQSEDSIISLEDNADEMTIEDGISLEQAMEMSVDDVLNEMASMEVDTVSEEVTAVEPETVNEPEEMGTGMLSEEAIAAMFASSEVSEPATEETVEEVAAVEPEIVNEPEEMETGMLSEEAIAAMFASSEVSEPAAEETVEEVAAVEPETVNEPEEMGTGMLSEEAIAAMFASSEVSEPATEETVEEVTAVETEGLGSEIMSEDFVSFDDMLAGMGEEESGALPEDISPLLEEIETESSTEDSGNDSILDLLNMMSDDEDLKDIGDLLKADEDSDFDISDEELFGDMPNEGEEEQQEDKSEKQGFFAKLFGKKKDKGAEEVNADENQQIIKEVEEEIKEEDKKAEEQEEKKKKKKAKKDKKSKKKGKGSGEEQGDGEENEAEDGKKGKKEKKKKAKKEKPPKEIEIALKEPPLPKKPVVLIMLMAASILALVLLSHNLINYQSSINKADNSFINRNYEEAYQNILGVTVKEDDKQLYARIRVMMKLEAKYEMYLSHIEQNKYDEALNDLIMGVIKYDQYKKDAEELGIQQAFDDELALIEEQLNVVFGVDVDQAREWYNTLSALDYTETVRNVVKAAGYSVEEPVEQEDTEGTAEDLSQFGVEAVE